LAQPNDLIATKEKKQRDEKFGLHDEGARIGGLKSLLNILDYAVSGYAFRPPPEFGKSSLWEIGLKSQIM
jgi:hypothetical protein